MNCCHYVIPILVIIIVRELYPISAAIPARHPTYEKVVTVGCLAGMAALIAYGSRTIIMTNMGML